MLPFNLRQDMNRSESLLSGDDVKYTCLGNVTSTSSLDSSGTLIIDPFEDNKVPETGEPVRSSFYYVNKHGFAYENLVSPQKNNAKKVPITSGPIMCNQFLVEMSKLDKNGIQMSKNEFPNSNERFDQESVTRSVPNDESSSSFNHSSNDETSNNSLVHREQNGDIVINTNLTIQEPIIEITSDHIKYINIFSILCCWCFPITGIIGIIFANLTRKYYNMRDLVQAKKYLKRSEWCLILTFFFGFTLIAIGFAILETYLFSGEKQNRSLYQHIGLPK